MQLQQFVLKIHTNYFAIVCTTHQIVLYTLRKQQHFSLLVDQLEP